MLIVATASVLSALGATEAEIRPSALRLLVTAGVGLLAPLFWPGNAATPARTALRIGVWSAAAATLAAGLIRILGNPVQPFARSLAACAMLLLLLLVTHTLAAALEARLRDRSGDVPGAREMAGRTLALVLALLGSLPLWLGPAGELLSSRREGIIDAVLGLSPLTHLAVASGNDLLRNQWFYQHSNLAALQFSYPGLASLVWAYATACLVLALIALALRFPRPRGIVAAPTHPTDLTQEKL